MNWKLHGNWNFTASKTGVHRSPRWHMKGTTIFFFFLKGLFYLNSCVHLNKLSLSKTLFLTVSCHTSLNILDLFELGHKSGKFFVCKNYLATRD